MKNIFLFISLLFSLVTTGQDFEKKWNKVVTLEHTDQIKSANSIVEKIYKKATENRNESQIIKCFFYKSKYLIRLDEQAQSKILNDLDFEIKNASIPTKAILNLVYAKCLTNFYNRFQYSLYKRTPLDSIETGNFLTWNDAAFKKEIEKRHQIAIENETILKNTLLSNYTEVIDIFDENQFKNESVYEYVLNENLEFYKRNIYYHYENNEDFKKLGNIFLGDSNTFKNLNLDFIKDKYLKKCYEIYQKLEALNNEKYIFERIKFSYEQFKYRFENYLNVLEILEQKTLNKNIHHKILLEKAILINEKVSLPKNKIIAMSILDRILDDKPKENVEILALNLKKQIEYKSITINILQNLYENEYARAHVSYCNTSEVKISIYKIHSNQIKLFSENEVNRLENIKEFVSKNTAHKTTIHSLPKRDDYYGNTTELMLPQLEIGNYLIYFETEKNQENKVNYTCEIITVSNLALYKIAEKNQETYQIVNRKSGKPIFNANINTPFETFKTDKNGKVVFQNSKEFQDCKVTSINFEKDSLIVRKSYIPTISKFDSISIKKQSAVVFYLDRAIYRPGQTVYFKGIASENNNQICKIIPNIRFKIIIKHNNYKVFKELVLTTNEFGSFSGEFVLSNLSLTGNFSIHVEEPDDYKNDSVYDKVKDQHPFWDNQDDFDDGRHYFKVEEYKRPKFDISFDKINEDPIINQKIVIKGRAKAFNGSNISEAKVKYSVNRNCYDDKGYLDGETKNYTNETKTDSYGNFLIEIQDTIIEKNFNKETHHLEYRINFDITDLNGETRSKSTEVKVGYKRLFAKIEVASSLNKNKNNTLGLSTKNLNDQFIPATGELKMYLIQENGNKLKNRIFEKPNFETISDKDFEQYFPYEANFGEVTIAETGIEVFSEKVDTQLEKTIDLSFIKNFKSGYYKFVFTAKDKDGNTSEDSKIININNSDDDYFSYEILEIKQLNNDVVKDGFVHLKLTSKVPELYISATGYYNSQQFHEEDINLKNNETYFKIPLHKLLKNGIELGFQTYFENQSFVQNYQVLFKKLESEELKFETETFRNKIEPGSKENWSFKIKAENKIEESEVLASMYDSSLDYFNVSDWNFPKINYIPYNHFQFKVTDQNKTKYSTTSSDYPYIIENSNAIERSNLMWFGFDFNENYSYQAIGLYKRQINKKAKKPLNSKLVYGIVSDEYGSLPGVNIVIKGTQRGTSTSFDGSYEIEAVEGEILVFSFMGMGDISRVYSTDNEINVFMQEEAKQLDAIIITGFGVKRKVDAVTSSYSVIKQEELNRKTDTNTVQALIGRVSGLQINKNENLVFGSNGIIIRGNKSINENNPALIIIDGVKSSSEKLKQLSPDEIESVAVLKGDQGAAIYGEEGINGVIIVFTKNAIKSLQNVTARKNLSETAFFFPHLKTDKEGKVSFNFTSPEALTEWKFRMLGHTKDVKSGYYQNSVVTQKDLMLTPNFPRFFREKDSIVIKTKISNLTPESKIGIAVLQLFDASTMEMVDLKMNNKIRFKNFNIPAFGNTTVSWKIYIPEGLQGVQYKILAKSGNFSDGEENIIPVIPNRILVTESMPVWVRENTNKTYTINNLKSSKSTTLSNHLLTFEYTSNPIWLALQSLPYLIEYEHECAEQTFARFYANALAAKIIDSNPKIKSVLELWKQNGKSVSKLNENQELKSILLAETPWLLDSESEEEKQKNLATLFDFDKMKGASKMAFEKLRLKQKPSGGFAWFDGGNESEYITRHIVSGLSHLDKLCKNDELSKEIDLIISKAIPYLDNTFLENNKNKVKNNLIWTNSTSDLHYLYTRSGVAHYNLTDELKNNIPKYLAEIKTNFTKFSLYEKAMASLILNRFDDKKSAKTFIEGLKQTAINNEESGMYWLENNSGVNWFQAPIETQSLLIEAFAEVENDTKSINAMKVWLLKKKLSKNWPTTKSTTEAIYALMLQGADWVNAAGNTNIVIVNETVLSQKNVENNIESDSGYKKFSWKNKDIKPEMATIQIQNKSETPVFGGIYWQYFEYLDKINANDKTDISVSKEMYVKNNKKNGELQKITTKNQLKIGDLVTVKLNISIKSDVDFIHLKDMRASCFEPINVISEYKWRDGLGYYMNTKDVATHFFFDQIKKGIYTIEYDLRVNNIGDFSDGIITIQSMYAPELSSHTKGIRIKVNE